MISVSSFSFKLLGFVMSPKCWFISFLEMSQAMQLQGTIQMLVDTETMPLNTVRYYEFRQGRDI